MKRGFTLVELLVVVAIIMLLLAILAPSMRGVLDLLDLTRCANNMRQIGQATMAYAGMHDRRFPGPNWRKANAKGWLYRNLQMDLPQHLEGGQLWPYLKDYRIYRCPADETDPATVPERPNNSRAITSYCANGSICSYGRRAYDGGTGYWDTWRYTDFLDPSRDIIMWEPDETKAGGWWWDGSNYPWEGITHRHIDRGMAVCVDGHAEWLTLDDYYRLGAGNAPGPNRLWNVPGSPNGR